MADRAPPERDSGTAGDLLRTAIYVARGKLGTGVAPLDTLTRHSMAGWPTYFQNRALPRGTQ